MWRIGWLAAAAALVAAAPAHAFEARGSAEQVYVTKAQPGTELRLLGPRGEVVQTRKANPLGAAPFREVRPGDGYRVQPAGGAASAPLTVLTTDPTPPSTDVYDQVVPPDGYGYLTTRDGTKLAYSVHPPSDAVNAVGANPPESSANGPWPTLIEYSGYGYARPQGGTNSIAAVANAMGFAVVDVNMRGTGCSGGAFDFFEPLQSLDGYDIVETIARQPWVKHGRVGMFGISYGGISQLFTAATRPPGLAAITPISVLDQTLTTLYPGGLLNTGFSVEWAKERQREALPAGKDAGQPWASERIAAGDQTCKENQALHAEAADLMAKIRDNSTYKPEVADPLAPQTFVDEITVPTFLACQHTDEQTGGHCPTLERAMRGNRKAWFTFTNGTHIDSLAPDTYNRLFDFLRLYVAREAPSVWAPAMRATAPVVFQAAFGISGVELPDDPIQRIPTYEAALRAFEAQDRVRILHDNGAGGPAGHPQAGYIAGYPSFPPPGVRARAFWLDADGTLDDARPPRARAAAFRWDARNRPATNFTGNTSSGTNGLWTATPPYRWSQQPAGSAAVYETPALEEPMVVLGQGAVYAWVRSSARRVDLQATITELRPDGKETFVQGGWLRGDLAKLDRARSTPLQPVLSLRKSDQRRLSSKRFRKVTIPLYFQTHAYRKGSKLRLRISAPNGDQPIWAFAEARPSGAADVAIAGGGRKYGSRLLLPVLPGAKVPTPLPPCPSLRGQPCRDAEPFTNRVVRVR
jgi:uncharacterized protein